MPEFMNAHFPVTHGETPNLQATNSATEGELAELQRGERWSLTATERAYNAGGAEAGGMTRGAAQQTL